MGYQHLLDQLNPDDRDRLEIGRLLQQAFAPGPGSCHVIYSRGDDDLEDPDSDYVATLLGPAGRRTGSGRSVLAALHDACPDAARKLRCQRCGHPRPASWFRLRLRAAGSGKGGRYHTELCRRCRREVRAAAGGRAAGRRA